MGGKIKTFEEQLEARKNKQLQKAVKNGAVVKESEDDKDIVERIKNYFLIGTKLNEKDDKKRQMIERAWALKIKYGPHKAAGMFVRLTGYSRSYTYDIFNMAKEILPSLDELTKKSSRMIQIERYSRLQEKVEKSTMDSDQKIALLLKINERIDKISGLENEELDLPSLKELLQIPKPVIFLNHADFLKNKTINIDEHQ